MEFGNVRPSNPGAVVLNDNSDTIMRTGMAKANATMNLGATLAEVGFAIKERDNKLTYAAERLRSEVAMAELEAGLEDDARALHARAVQENFTPEQYEDEWKTTNESRYGVYQNQIEGFRSNARTQSQAALEVAKVRQDSYWREKYKNAYTLDQSNRDITRTVDFMVKAAGRTDDINVVNYYVGKAAELIERHRAIRGDQQTDGDLSRIRVEAQDQFLINMALNGVASPEEMEGMTTEQQMRAGVDRAVSWITENAEEFSLLRTPEHQARLIGQLRSIGEGKVNSYQQSVQEQKRAQHEVMAQYSTSIQSARLGLSKDDWSEDRINRDFLAGRIDEETRNQEVMRNREHLKKGADDLAALQLGRTFSVAAGVRPNMDSKEVRDALDERYKVEVLGSGVPPTPDSMVAFASNVGGIPPKMLTDLVSGVFNENLAPGAAAVIQRLSQNPLLASQVTKEKLGDEAWTLLSFINAGRPYTEARQLTTSAMSVPGEQRVARGSFYTGSDNKEFREESVGVLQDKLNDAYVEYGGWFQDDVPELPVELRAYFNSQIKENYERMGDLNAAREAAIRDTQTRWSITAVNGAPQWVQGIAPEKAFNAPPEYIREQLDTDLKGLTSERTGLFWDNNLRQYVVKEYDTILQDWVYFEGPDENGNTVFPWAWEYDPTQRNAEQQAKVEEQAAETRMVRELAQRGIDDPFAVNDIVSRQMVEWRKKNQ